MTEYNSENPKHLYELYHEKDMTQTEMARVCECTQSNISRQMSKYDIRALEPSERINPNAPWKSEERVRDLYHGEGLSTTECAERLGCAQSTLIHWMEQHGIERRDRTDYTGEKAANWKGGHTKYYGPNWNEQRQKRLERDDYKCVVCGISNEEHKERKGNSLEIHHIQRKASFVDENGVVDYERANRIENLITLCSVCHKKWEGIPLRPEV